MQITMKEDHMSQPRVVRENGVERGQSLWIALQIAFQFLSLSAAHASPIVGGEEVEASDYYSQTTVALLTRTARGGSICTASIIADDLLVTAAHCVSDIFGRALSASSHRIIFNADVDHASDSDVRLVDGVKVNPNYKGSAGSGKDQSDIAIVHFVGGIPSGFKIASLLPTSLKLKKGQTVTLAGYGVTTMENGGDGAGVLRKVDTKIATPAFGKTEVLIDQRGGHGACHGDSGGPASVTVGSKIYLFGVTNRGYPENAPDDCKQFSVYTNINAHKSFVSQAAAELRKVAGTTTNWPRN